MKRLLLCAALVVAFIAMPGMTCVTGPVVAPIVIEQRAPIGVGDTQAPATKVGRSKASGIILVSFGDASIARACKEANITRIHHVDAEVLSILGVYSRWETLVYGE